MVRHWAIYDIDAQRNILPEGTHAAKTESLEHGINDFGNRHYDGPQPPRGHGLHHYHFRLLALNVKTLHLDEKTPIEEVMRKAEPHILGQAELVGTFERN